MDNARVIGIEGIAQLLKVSPNTPNQWQQRRKKGLLRVPMPDPVPGVGIPIWYIEDIVRWAVESGRWPKENGSWKTYLRNLEADSSSGSSSREPDPEAIPPDRVTSKSTNAGIPAVLFYAGV